MSQNDTDFRASSELIQNTSADICASASIDMVQNTSPDVSSEVDDIASVSDSKSATSNEASDSVLTGEERCAGLSCRSQESDSGKVQEIPALEPIQECGCKRKRAIDDVGGTSNRKSADDLEYKEWFDEETSEHLCWTEKSQIYRVKQMQQIRDKRDASELFRCMTANIKNLMKSDIACYHRWWLTTATRYNHISLVSLLLADRDCSDHNNVAYARRCALHSKRGSRLGRPLHIAIENGHESLVQAFLLAGASVTDTFEDVQDDESIRFQPVKNVSHQKPIHEHVSAVEYALICNQPEILALLLAHFNCQHPPRHHADVSDSCNKSKPEEHITHPLHSVIKLATQFYGPHCAQLPALVQQIISDGTDVDCLDQYGNTPLQALIQRIRLIAPLNEEGSAYRSTLIKIIKILLRAGANVNTVSENNTLRRLKRLLFPLYYNEMRGLETMRVSYAYAIRDHLQFANDLAMLLLLHGADLTRCRFHKHILREASSMLIFMKTAWGLVLCDEILHSQSHLLRSALLSESTCQTDDEWKQLIDMAGFAHSILNITHHSCQPGRSEKLIYTILNAFSASNLKKLLDKLQGWKLFKEEQMNSTIKYVNIVMGVMCAPRSLQDLSRRAILRAMSARALLPYTEVDLGLPAKLKEFVLL